MENTYGNVLALYNKVPQNLMKAIALNTIGREMGDGVPGANTARTTSLGIQWNNILPCVVN